jgi:tetratricopeptide (TPR) repeat protein
MSKIGRNAPCPCGSGKKYKKCCLKNERLNRNLERLGEIAEAMCFYGEIEDEDLEFVDSLKGTSSEKLRILCDSVLSYPLNFGNLTAEDYTAISASMIDRDRAGFYEAFAFFNDFSENTDAAEALYDRSIEPYNKHGDHYDVARALSKKAMMQFDLGRHGEAIALLKEATEIGDDVEGEAGNFVNLGLVYSDMGDYKIALDCYKKALRIFDRLGNAEQKRNIYRVMAGAYKMLGDEEAAKLYLDKAGIEEVIEEEEISREEERLILKIDLLVKRGKIEKAIETCPENPDLLSQMAGSFAMQDHIMAGKFLRKMVEKFPHHGRSHYNLGLYLRENGEIERAEKEYRRCIELDPAYLDAYINLGNILHIKGKNEEAEKILNKGIELGEDPLLFHALGNVYADTNRFDDAEDMYRKSLGMGYSFAEFGLDTLKEKRAGKLSGSGRRMWVTTPHESKGGEMTKREFAQFAGFRNLREYEKEARKAQRLERDS